MELSEFLLARFAEDEKAARAWLRVYNDPGRAPQYHYETMRRHRAEWPLLWRSLDRFTPARVLAECEAKRRMLALLDECSDTKPHVPRLTIYTRDVIPKILALPYADHPDYDEKWKP